MFATIYVNGFYSQCVGSATLNFRTSVFITHRKHIDKITIFANLTGESRWTKKTVIMAKKIRNKYTFIDLFAGCGGLSEGFLETGLFCPLAHVEWETPMVNTLRNRLITKWGYSEEEAKKTVIQFDVQKSEELIKGNWDKDSIELYGQYNHKDVIKKGLKGIVGRKKVNLVIGGPPCQAYSIHGRATDKNSMQDDYRNYLFESFVKVVTAFQPDIFVFENVVGMLSARPGGKHVTERIYEAFTTVGYEIRNPKDLNHSVYNAFDFGVPQNRPRVIILGVKKNGQYNLDDLYKAISSEIKNIPHKTVRDAIYDLPHILPLTKPIRVGKRNISHKVINPNPSITQHEPRFHALREINVFREWVTNKMNYISQREKINYYYKITGHKTLYAKYKSLEWDKPAHTIVAHLSKDGYMFIHPDPNQARSITIREAALLMTFPMDYYFIGNTAMCFKMIGNAVPVLMAKSIATGIAKEMMK